MGSLSGATMVIGFSVDQNFDPIIGWSLDQVTIDKYHVMFFFNEGRDLLNVAHKFEYFSADGKTKATYEVYGDKKLIAVEDLLRTSIASWKVVSIDELCLTFANGARLSIFDSRDIRSWWFMRYEEGGAESAFILSDLENDLIEEKRK